VYWVHLLWALFVFLYLIHFWWWEYRLGAIQQWTFPLYFFITLYAVIQFLLSVLLFLEEMADYSGFKDYFYSQRRWIFTLMTILFVADVIDTVIKSSGYLRALGPAYYVRTALYILLSAAAIKIKNERFHAAFAVFATLSEIALILKDYRTLG
jgi:phage-related holin